MLKALLGYLPWWDCMLMVGERNFPECRAAAGWPAPKWPGDGGILPGAAEAPSRCDSIAASPESSGGGTCTDLGGPKSRPSIIHPRAIKKGKKRGKKKKNMLRSAIPKELYTNNNNVPRFPGKSASLSGIVPTYKKTKNK